MKPKTLDHVAVWVEDRDAVAAECERRYGMHVIDRNDKFTLVGVDARRGKLTLFEAEGPRDQGVLKHVALRASTAQEFEDFGKHYREDFTRRIRHGPTGYWGAV